MNIVAAYGGNNTSGPRAVASALSAHGGACGRMDFETETFIAHTLRGEGFDASEDGTGRGTPLVPWRIGLVDTTGHQGDRVVAAGDVTQALTAQGANNAGGGGTLLLAAGAHAPAIAFQERGRDGGRALEIGGDVAYAMTAPSGGGRAQERNVMQGAAVRRLMPVECERLQGFPDGYTAIPWRGKPASERPDGPRYKALGNSWAVNCARWIGRRISLVEQIHAARRDAA